MALRIMNARRSTAFCIPSVLNSGTRERSVSWSRDMDNLFVGFEIRSRAMVIQQMPCRMSRRPHENGKC
jgi:hypothetical protein